MANIPLADAIGELRRQITSAIKEGEDEPLKFRLADIELELKLQVENRTEGNARVTLWSVLVLGGGAATADTTVHILKLKLRPVGAGGGEIEISR